MRYFKKLIGERIYLSPINLDDTEIYTKWLNDFEVCKGLGNFRMMISLDNERKFLEQLSTDGHNYAIILNNDDTLIGNVGIIEIDNINRTATVGLFIGEHENRGKGYGSEALRLILDFGFKTLNLHNIMLHVHSDNEQGIACYEKVGFKEFGRRHEARFIDGEYIDLVNMEITDDIFYGTA